MPQQATESVWTWVTGKMEQLVGQEGWEQELSTAFIEMGSADAWRGLTDEQLFGVLSLVERALDNRRLYGVAPWLKE